jgi:hypothetical protein
VDLTDKKLKNASVPAEFLRVERNGGRMESFTVNFGKIVIPKSAAAFN